MNKWFLKNRDGILKTIIAGIGLKIISEVLPKFVINYKNIVIDYLSKVLNFSITLKIFHVILFIFLWLLVSLIYRKIKSSSNRLKVMEAKYYTDLYSLDITRELNDAIEKDKLYIVLSNNIAGDPHKGTIKKGLIKYKINGSENKKEYKEGDLIEIP